MNVVSGTKLVFFFQMTKFLGKIIQKSILPYVSYFINVHVFQLSPNLEDAVTQGVCCFFISHLSLNILQFYKLLTGCSKRSAVLADYGCSKSSKSSKGERRGGEGKRY
jgi:hypothetical protein